MYYFSYKNIQYGNFSYRSYSLYHEGKASILSKSSVTVNAKIKIYDKSLMGAMSSLVCSTRLRGRHRGSVNIRVALDLTVNNKVLVLSKASIKGKAAIPVNAVLKHNVKLTMVAKTNCIASAKTVERLKGRATLSANSSLISNELLKHYGQCSLKSKAAIVSDSRVPVYARAVIKSNTNADVNSKVVTRLYGDADFKSYTGVAIFSLLNLYSASSAIQSNITFTINSLLKHYEQCHLSTNVSIATNSKVYTRQRASVQITCQANTVSNGIVKIYADTGISNYFSYANIDYGNFCYTPYSQYYNIIGRGEVDCSSVLRVYANATTLTAGASLNVNSKTNTLLRASSTIKNTTAIVVDSLLRHYPEVQIKAVASATVNAKAITVRKGAGQIAVTSNVVVNTLLRWYANSQIEATASLVSDGKVLKYASASIATSTNLIINTKLYKQTRASSQAWATTSLIINTLLTHYATSFVECNSTLTTNAKWIFVKRSDGELKSRASLIADSKVYTQIRERSTIQVNTSFLSNTILRHLSNIDIQSHLGLVIDNSFISILSNANISGNADLTTIGIRRLFEQIRIHSKLEIVVKEAIRENISIEISANASMGVDSIVAIYANVIIEAGVSVKANTTEVIYANIADKDTYSFSFGGKCYFYNGDDFYYYDGDIVGRVVDIAYVPTFTMGRSPTGGGVQFEGLNYLSNSWKDSFSTTDEDAAYQLSFDNLSNDTVLVWLNGEKKTEGDDFTVDRSTGIVTLTTELEEGTDNLVIQASKDGLMNSEFITKATKFIIYGGKNDNRVFACRGNTRYHSGLNDPTYWAENNYTAITSDFEDIVGFGRMYDYLINLKENSLTFSTIESDIDGDVIFPVYPLNDEYGCLAKDSIQSVANGLIFLAQTSTGASAGVAYLSPTTVRNQLNVKIISEEINKSIHAGIIGLEEYPLSGLRNAKSYIYDDKYWLKVDDKIWILDLKESSLELGKYCWYPYDGSVASANCFMESEGEFFVGSERDSKIYKEHKGFNDDEDAINAYWTSPIVFCGSRSWTKDFEELHIVFSPQVVANHRLTIITEDDVEDIDLEIESARLFTYIDLSYEYFHYGSNPYPSKQTELVGYSSEYLQWVITNDMPNESIGILAQELDYLWGERS